MTWHSYQLDPTLSEHYDGTELEYLATRKGMAPDHVSQMFRGHQLLHLAAEQGVADGVKEALLSAHFEHGEDIGSTDVLSRIGVAAGLDADAIRAALEQAWREANPLAMVPPGAGEPGTGGTGVCGPDGCTI